MRETIDQYIIVGYNHLAFNCQTRVGGDYWPHYQLGYQENGAGCSYSEALQEWDECDAGQEKIVVSTPGIEVPEWCGSCQIYWQLLKQESDGETEYMEVGLIVEDDDESLNAWYRWHDSGFSESCPED